MRAALLGLALVVALQATARAQAAAPPITFSVVTRPPIPHWPNTDVGFIARIKNVSSRAVRISRDFTFAIHARSVNRGQQPLEIVRSEVDWLSPPPAQPLRPLGPGATTYLWFSGLHSMMRPNISLDCKLPGPGTYTVVFEYIGIDAGDQNVGPIVAAPTSFRIDPPLPPPPPAIRLEVEAQHPTVQWVPHALSAPGSRAFDQLTFLVRIKNISKERLFLCVDSFYAIHPIRVLRQGDTVADLGGPETLDWLHEKPFQVEVQRLEPGHTLERRVEGLRSEEVLDFGSIRTHGFIDDGKGHYQVQFEYRCDYNAAYAGQVASNWVSFEVN